MRMSASMENASAGNSRSITHATTAFQELYVHDFGSCGKTPFLKTLTLRVCSAGEGHSVKSPFKAEFVVSSGTRQRS